MSKQKKFNDLINIDGIGETQINSIKNFSNNINLKMIRELSELVDIKDAVLAKSNGLLNNKTFMITGKLEV